MAFPTDPNAPVANDPILRRARVAGPTWVATLKDIRDIPTTDEEN